MEPVPLAEVVGDVLSSLMLLQRFTPPPPEPERQPEQLEFNWNGGEQHADK
jgi:hypothetical protein